MHRTEPDEVVMFINGNEQCIRWLMVDDKLVPLIPRKHRFANKVTQKRPSLANGRVKYGPNPLGIAGNSASYRNHALGR